MVAGSMSYPVTVDRVQLQSNLLAEQVTWKVE
jgi:hypothetical protein